MLLLQVFVNLFHFEATVEAIAAAKKAQTEMYTALLTKREVLVEELESKLTAYKGLLLKEMVKQITLLCTWKFLLLNISVDILQTTRLIHT